MTLGRQLLDCIRLMVKNEVMLAQLISNAEEVRRMMKQLILPSLAREQSLTWTGFAKSSLKSLTCMKLACARPNDRHQVFLQRLSTQPDGLFDHQPSKA